MGGFSGILMGGFKVGSKATRSYNLPKNGLVEQTSKKTIRLQKSNNKKTTKKQQNKQHNKVMTTQTVIKP